MELMSCRVYCGILLVLVSTAFAVDQGPTVTVQYTPTQCCENKLPCCTPATKKAIIVDSLQPQQCCEQKLPCCTMQPQECCAKKLACCSPVAIHENETLHVIDHPHVVESIVPQSQCCEFKLPCCSASSTVVRYSQGHCCTQHLSCCELDAVKLSSHIKTEEMALKAEEKRQKLIASRLELMKKKLAGAVLRNQKHQKAALAHDLKVVNGELKKLKKAKEEAESKIGKLDAKIKSSKAEVGDDGEEGEEDASESVNDVRTQIIPTHITMGKAQDVVQVQSVPTSVAGEIVATK